MYMVVDRGWLCTKVRVGGGTRWGPGGRAQCRSVGSAIVADGGALAEPPASRVRPNEPQTNNQPRAVRVLRALGGHDLVVAWL